MITTERKPLAHWIPGQARNDVSLGVSALQQAPLYLYSRSLYRHFPFLKAWISNIRHPGRRRAREVTLIRDP